jgi:acetyltransferase-like isoleucine patch superfamily enzyme
MKRPLFRRILNRVFHLLARTTPGSTGLRPALHRMRGMTIGEDVFIGDEVYLENEYPEAVEIQSGVQISVRAIIIAHTQGCGRVIIEKNAYIGPNAVIVTSGNKTLRIGEGAVIGASVVVTKDVPAGVFMANDSAKPIARVTVPLTKVDKMEDFIRGLAPLKSVSMSNGGGKQNATPADRSVRAA